MNDIYLFLAGDAVGGELEEEAPASFEARWPEDEWDSIAGASAARAVVSPETPSKSA